MKLLKKISLVISFLSLAACQTVPVLDGQDNGTKLKAKQSSIFSEKQQAVKDLPAWNMSGPFSYADQYSVATGSINWKGDIQPNPDKKDDTILAQRIDLQGPFNAGSATLFIDSELGAALAVGSTRAYGKDAKNLLFEETGWSIPVKELRYWVYGLPFPDKKSRYWLDEKGNLALLLQSQWQIRFSEYQQLESSNGVIKKYPKKVFAENRGRGLKVRLVIKKLELQ